MDEVTKSQQYKALIDQARKEACSRRNMRNCNDVFRSELASRGLKIVERDNSAEFDPSLYPPGGPYAAPYSYSEAPNPWSPTSVIVWETEGAAPAMERVTIATLEAFIQRYVDARGGEYEEHTSSEASFVFLNKDRGAYALSVTFASRILWIGLQNASSYWSNRGTPFANIRDALLTVLFASDLESDLDGGVFYNEDSVSRLRFVADQIERYKIERKADLS